MPELPEVETVRRGLQPVMEGARIVVAETRRKDLRFPFQKDFVARLTGQTVTGLGRRAKYLLADLGSGDVLLMHLGMSGSFRVLKPDDATTPGEFHHPRSKDESHDHVVRDREEFARIQRYIEDNSVKAGLVMTPEEFPWTSAAPAERPAAARKG